ncbi:MAG: hypothetical protein HRU09_08305 [Oligoflexales bacterium]|nr:hypothetical protein [Oligoflexales bacterium]
MSKIKSRQIHSYLQIFILSMLTFIVFPWFLMQSDEVDLMKINEPPSFYYLLGTDSLGRDLLSRISLNIYVNVFPICGIAIFSHAISTLCFIQSLTYQRSNKVTSFFNSVSQFIYALPLPIMVVAGAMIFDVHAIHTIWLTLFIFFFSSTWLLLQNLYAQSIEQHYWETYLLAGGCLKSLVFKYGVLGSWFSTLTNRLIVHFQQGLLIEVAFSYFGFGITEPTPSFGNMMSAHYEQIFNAEGTSLFVVIACLNLCLVAPKATLNLLNLLRNASL